MKANYKKIFINGLGTVMIISILAPLLISAQNDNAEEKARGYCGRLSEISSKIDQRIANRDAKLEEKRARIADIIKTRQTKRDVKIAEKRAKWDANRAEHFAKLEEKAGNDEQKQAALDFKEAMSEAISIRRAAINQAIQDFRQGTKEAIASRKASADSAVLALRTSIKSAFEKAESDCDTGIEARTVRENLRADLKTAKEQFTIAKQGIDKLGVQKEILIDQKKEAINKAIDDFKTAVETAKADFKAASAQENSEE